MVKRTRAPAVKEDNISYVRHTVGLVDPLVLLVRKRQVLDAVLLGCIIFVLVRMPVTMPIALVHVELEGSIPRASAPPILFFRLVPGSPKRVDACLRRVVTLAVSRVVFEFTCQPIPIRSLQVGAELVVLLPARVLLGTARALAHMALPLGLVLALHRCLPLDAIRVRASNLAFIPDCALDLALEDGRQIALGLLPGVRQLVLLVVVRVGGARALGIELARMLAPAPDERLARGNPERQHVLDPELRDALLESRLLPLEVPQVRRQRVPVAQHVHGNAVLPGVRGAIKPDVPLRVHLEQHLLLRGLSDGQQLQRRRRELHGRPRLLGDDRRRQAAAERD